MKQKFGSLLEENYVKSLRHNDVIIITIVLFLNSFWLLITSL